MPADLKNILITASDLDFGDRIRALAAEHSMTGFLKTRSEIARRAKDIVDAVASRGDEAIVECTARFDRVDLTPDQFRISPDRLKAAHRSLDPALLKSLRKAVENVTQYQSSIFIPNTPQPAGIRYTPLKRVGLCIPGASAPLPSTVIMTAVPAIVAGVEQIVVVSPPRCEGSIHPVILAACHELGITEVYRLGGAQAVAALAWSTTTIPKVDKIVGPGNDYVQLAKKEVFGLVDIDSFAGPSDVLIIADETANPAWLAADVLSQAEHNPGAGILVTHSAPLAHSVLTQLAEQVEHLDRALAALDCLRRFSAVVVLDSLDDVIAFVNNFAPEHLQIQCGDNTQSVLDRIENAGAIFLGPYSPVAVGDYLAGPSHTLPTRQTTKHFSALTSNDFIKSSSIISWDRQTLIQNAPDIINIASIEGLDAHARSIKIRLQ